MRKIISLILFASLITICISACSTRPAKSMIQSERRFAKYVEASDTDSNNVVDLSDGRKLKYNKYFGPQNLNFDIKIHDPYW